MDASSVPPAELHAGTAAAVHYNGPSFAGTPQPRRRQVAPGQLVGGGFSGGSVGGGGGGGSSGSW